MQSHRHHLAWRTRFPAATLRSAGSSQHSNSLRAKGKINNSHRICGISHPSRTCTPPHTPIPTRAHAHLRAFAHPLPPAFSQRPLVLLSHLIKVSTQSDPQLRRLPDLFTQGSTPGPSLSTPLPRWFSFVALITTFTLCPLFPISPLPPNCELPGSRACCCPPPGAVLCRRGTLCVVRENE